MYGLQYEAMYKQSDNEGHEKQIVAKKEPNAGD